MDFYFPRYIYHPTKRGKRLNDAKSFHSSYRRPNTFHFKWSDYIELYEHFHENQYYIYTHISDWYWPSTIYTAHDNIRIEACEEAYDDSKCPYKWSSAAIIKQSAVYQICT